MRRTTIIQSSGSSSSACNTCGRGSTSEAVLNVREPVLSVLLDVILEILPFCKYLPLRKGAMGGKLIAVSRVSSNVGPSELTKAFRELCPVDDRGGTPDDTVTGSDEARGGNSDISCIPPDDVGETSRKELLMDIAPVVVRDSSSVIFSMSLSRSASRAMEI